MSSRRKPALCIRCGRRNFTYFKVLGWGWYYLSTILDDYSRFIVHWEVCKTMKAEDVLRTVEQAMAKAGLDLYQQAKLLFDNGACYIASKLKTFLNDKGITPIRGKMNHPQT